MSQRHPHDYVDFGIEPELMTEDYKAYLRGYAEGRSAALAAERDRLREAAELVIAAYSMGHRKRYAALDTAIPALRAALAPGTPVDLE